jgi:hypothetical protein
MQNAKCRVANEEEAERSKHSRFNILHFAFCIDLLPLLNRRAENPYNRGEVPK